MNYNSGGGGNQRKNSNNNNDDQNLKHQTSKTSYYQNSRTNTDRYLLFKSSFFL